MNQRMTSTEYVSLQTKVMKDLWQFPIVGIYKYYPYRVRTLFQGKVVCHRQGEIILFESCEWCGSHKGVKEDLNGDDCCVCCGGPV